MITEHRKKYLKRWRDEHRTHIRNYFRNWSGVKKPRLTSDKKIEGFYGTSGLGRKYELIAQTLLRGSILSPHFHYPFDLEWMGTKIDVKIRNKNKKGNYFFSKKPKCTADYFLCFCVDKKIKYILLVPKSVYGNFFKLTDRKVEEDYKKYLFIIEEQ